MLTSMNIVHYDLKGNNIMFNEINKLPLILDFGLSIKMDELRQIIWISFYIYAPDYSPWPLGALYFIFVEVNDPSITDLENMVSEFVDNDTSQLIYCFHRILLINIKRYA